MQTFLLFFGFWADFCLFLSLGFMFVVCCLWFRMDGKKEKKLKQLAQAAVNIQYVNMSKRMYALRYLRGKPEDILCGMWEKNIRRPYRIRTNERKQIYTLTRSVYFCIHSCIFGWTIGVLSQNRKRTRARERPIE